MATGGGFPGRSVSRRDLEPGTETETEARQTASRTTALGDVHAVLHGWALDRSPHALVIVDGACIVRHANPAALAMLRRSTSITIETKTLRVISARMDARLRRLVTDALEEAGPPTVHVLRVPSSSSGDMLDITLTRLVGGSD
jgi:nitrogen-specific signal transduction histidine kinase